MLHAREPPPTAPLDAILRPSAQVMLRSEIAAAAGGEVFFLGRLDPGGAVAEVEVIARGNRTSVPALLDRANEFHVAIHNHPSGNLLPSDADLSIAHELAAEGLGFLIVDDEVERLYEVIPARRARPLVPVEGAEIEAFLGPDGPLSRVLGDTYEPRPAQARMSCQTADAITQDGLALLEAGTGTGKTFAYLVPGALFALRNKQKVVVSTATKNLQGQIVRKDVPNLREALNHQEEGAGDRLRVVVVKGRGNYVSLRRAAEALEGDAQLFEDDDELKEVKRLATWAESTSTGDREELLPPASAEAWERVTSTVDDCMGPKCPRFGACHYYNARRAAAQAHVLIVNHHLLFADLAIKQETGFERAAALPPYHRVVFDEAHHAEAIASEHFGLALTQLGLVRPLGRLQLRRRRDRGLIPALVRALARGGASLAPLARELEERIAPLRAHTLETLELSLAEVAAAVRSAAKPSEARAREVRLRLRAADDRLLEPLQDAQKSLAILAARLQRFVESTRSFLGESREHKALPLLRQLEAVVKQLTRNANGLRSFCRGGQPPLEVEEAGGGSERSAGFPGLPASWTGAEEAPPGVAPGSSQDTVQGPLGRKPKAGPPVEFVRWAEVSRGRHGRDRLRLRLAPLDVGPLLLEALFQPTKAVIMTSATLTVQGRTDYLEKRLGLAQPSAQQRPPFKVVQRDRIPSPFEYSRQALLAIPTDLPSVDHEGYEAGVIEALRELLKVSRGRAFCLFTSYAQLNRAYDELEEELLEAGLIPLRQGTASRTQLLERFRATPQAVLFGTDSFWEGVDVPGDDLVLVCIARLPFSVPSEPLAAARAEAIEARGGSSFYEMMLPRAVLKLTQGFGRLIRSHSDEGVVAVLDNRLVTRPYGRAFFESLPPVRIEAAPLMDLLPTVRRYVR